jgi:hypothetical protein
LAVEAGLRRDLERIPAEIVADQAVKLIKANQLFLTGRELEMASYSVALSTFDSFNVSTKSMLGALLDYAGIDRERFANAWAEKKDMTGAEKISSRPSEDTTLPPTLFDEK